MSQDWSVDVYDKDAFTAHAIMSNMELMFATLKSTFSGGSEPSNLEAGMQWFDTAKKLLKCRNSADDGWRGILAGSASLKLWIYLNAAAEGFAVDSTADVVLALKGGSQAYNVSGGGTAGVWSLSHGHGPGSFTANTYHRHGADTGVSGNIGLEATFPVWTNYQGSSSQPVGGSSDDGTMGSTYRPLAAVGTLQYPDV